MKITWLSNAPWAATGYGNQTKLFVPRLQALGHELAIIAFYGLEGGVLTWHGAHVLPRGFHSYGQDVVAAHSANFQADIAISLIDAWVLEPKMHLHNMKWVPWFPVDMEPLPPPVAAKVVDSFQPIVYSKFAERMAANAGIDVRYVPHGIDTNLFKPLDRKQARDNLRWPKDKFIVGMVAANKGTPSRKALPQSLQAFAEFHRRHPDSMLYLHTHKGTAGEMGGVNLPEIVSALGLERDVVFSDQYQGLIGFHDDYMAAAYNGMDVLLACSMGEGFGLPIVESQACGTPVIVGDWTAMSELCFGGWKIDRKDADPTWTPLASYQFTPRIGPLVDALEQAWKYSGNIVYRDNARDGARYYDADRVTKKFWAPVLSEIGERLGISVPTPVQIPVSVETEMVPV